MPSAEAIIKKISGALKKVKATDRDVYKRVYTNTGGDDLLGIPGTVRVYDYILDPQPSVTALSFSGKLAVWMGERIQFDDLVLVVSPATLTRDELSDKNLKFVFKSTDGSEEEFSLVTYSSSMFGGSAVAHTVVVRSQGGRK